MQKNNRITIVSLSKGNAESKAVTSNFKPSIDQIVLSGLKTLIILSDLKFTDQPSVKQGIRPDMTMVKSMTFHASRKQAFLFTMSPMPDILNTISTVYNI